MIPKDFARSKTELHYELDPTEKFMEEAGGGSSFSSSPKLCSENSFGELTKLCEQNAAKYRSTAAMEGDLVKITLFFILCWWLVPTEAILPILPSTYTPLQHPVLLSTLSTRLYQTAKKIFRTNRKLFEELPAPPAFSVNFSTGSNSCAG